MDKFLSEHVTNKAELDAHIATLMIPHANILCTDEATKAFKAVLVQKIYQRMCEQAPKNFIESMMGSVALLFQGGNAVGIFIECFLTDFQREILVKEERFFQNVGVSIADGGCKFPDQPTAVSLLKPKVQGQRPQRNHQCLNHDLKRGEWKCQSITIL